MDRGNNNGQKQSIQRDGTNGVQGVVKCRRPILLLESSGRCEFEFRSLLWIIPDE